MFDVLIIGGGVSGMSSALMLGSARTQEYAKDKKIGILLHQRSSSLQNAIFNNVLGLKPNTTGTSILKNGKKHLKKAYPHVSQIDFEKVLKITPNNSEAIENYTFTFFLSSIIVLSSIGVFVFITGVFWIL